MLNLKKYYKKFNHKDFIVIFSICISVFITNLFNRATTPMCASERTQIEQQEKLLKTQKEQYEDLLSNHKKSQALITATTSEVKRLSNLLKQYSGKTDDSFTITNTEKDRNYVLSVVADYIKANESFSSIAYCDANNTYHNGYGTKAEYVYYKQGTQIRLRDCTGKIVTITATEKNKYLPEIKITVQEALNRKKQHIAKSVIPYLYGITFRSDEELIAVVDTIYNRGITQSKDLFTKYKTVNCKALYTFMTHSNKLYQKAMRNRYAKNYAMCIQ